MIAHVLWTSGNSSQWLDALSLPTQPWVAPFLERMRFPSKLAQQMPIFSKINADAVKQHAALWQANDALPYSQELDWAITEEFVNEALKHLVATVGVETTKLFKQWVEQNFVHEDYAPALLAWRVILRHACGHGNPAYQLVNPPPALLVLLPPIADFVDHTKDQQIHAELHHRSPPYDDPEMLGIDLSPEALMVEEIIRNVSTRDALQLIARTLSRAERAEVVTWAEAQALSQQIPPHILLGHTLLDQHL